MAVVTKMATKIFRGGCAGRGRSPGRRDWGERACADGPERVDGFDPVTFVHTDTLDNSRNRLLAGRVWARLGDDVTPWSGQLSASLLGSSNRNFWPSGRSTAQAGPDASSTCRFERRFWTGAVAHTIIAAAEAERETFHARDTIYGGFSDQDRTREHQALTLEWRGETKRVTGDIAVRRDIFNRFRDVTSLRASLLTNVGGGFAVAGSYAEGIAQPTFFDLYGFFPGSFLEIHRLSRKAPAGSRLRCAFAADRSRHRSRATSNACTTRSSTCSAQSPLRSIDQAGVIALELKRN